MDNIKQDEIINKNNKIAKLIDQYGEEDAYRYIEGNHQADILVDQSYSLQDIKTPSVTKYHNKYIFKSTRKKNTAKGNTNTIINTRIKSNIKEIIKIKTIKKEKYNITKKNTTTLTGFHFSLSFSKPKPTPHASSTITTSSSSSLKSSHPSPSPSLPPSSTTTTPTTTSNKPTTTSTKPSTITKRKHPKIFRDKNPSREDSRKMMRMINGTLSTCEKIYRLIEVALCRPPSQIAVERHELRFRPNDGLTQVQPELGQNLAYNASESP